MTIPDIGEDARGQLVIPAYPDEIWFLPCCVNAMRKRVTFQFLRDRFAVPREDFDESLLAAHADYFETSRKSVRPRYGIRVDDLKEFLQKRQPTGRDHSGCHNA